MNMNDYYIYTDEYGREISEWEYRRRQAEADAYWARLNGYGSYRSVGDPAPTYY